jgi:hypothetical protein
MRQNFLSGYHLSATLGWCLLNGNPPPPSLMGFKNSACFSRSNTRPCFYSRWHVYCRSWLKTRHRILIEAVQMSHARRTHAAAASHVFCWRPLTESQSSSCFHRLTYSAISSFISSECFHRTRCVSLGFQVLTTKNMKMAVTWIVAPCRLVEVYRRFTRAFKRAMSQASLKRR